MRLSDVLSKPPKNEYKQVEGFLVNKQGNVGQMVKLQAGTVSLNFFCECCDDLRTFSSQGRLVCVFISKNLISIDCVLKCICGTKVGMWFLVESEDDITLPAPKVRIVKRSEKLQENVKPRIKRYGDFDDLLSKAELTYREELKFVDGETLDYTFDHTTSHRQPCNIWKNCFQRVSESK